MDVKKLLDVYLWRRQIEGKINYGKSNKLNSKKNKLVYVLYSILEIPNFPFIRYRFSSDESIMLTYSTFKRDKKDSKWRDPYVEAAIKHERHKIYIVEKINRGIRRSPSYYESRYIYTPLFLGIGFIAKLFSLFFFTNEFYKLYKKNINLIKEVKKVQAHYLHALLLSKLLNFLIGYKRRPKIIYVTQIHAIESMAFSLYGASINVPVCEVQHGLILKSSSLYNFPYLREAHPFYPNSFLVKNNIVKKMLVNCNRALHENVNEISIEPICYEVDYEYDYLICLGPADLNNEITEKILVSKSKKYLIRAHPGFKNPFTKSNEFKNISKILNMPFVDISRNNQLESDFHKAPAVICGATTIIIDAVTLNKKIITWDKNALVIFNEYNKYIFNLEDCEL